MRNKELENFINENNFSYTCKDIELLKEKRFFSHFPDDEDKKKEDPSETEDKER